MKIDEYSLAFNCPGCPSWGTAIVEQDTQLRHLIKVEDAGNIILGMVHNQMPINTHDFYLPIGKGAKIYYGDTGFEGATSEPILVSVFNKTMINGKSIDYPFILVLIKDRAEDHKGRLQLKYSPKICYGSISNIEFFKKAVSVLGITESTPFMIYDIDVENQETLVMTAVFGDSPDDIRKGIDGILAKKIIHTKRTRIDIVNEVTSLTEDELVKTLNSWYNEDGPNAIRVFGIKYGSFFVDKDISVSKFLKKCKDIGSSYETELSKGIQIYRSIKSGEFGLYFYDDLYKSSKYKVESDLPVQLIYYGAPGTSKSTTIKNKIGNAPQHRITFHPDTDYSSFVGCYKPTKESGTKEITYKFVAQTFVKAYVEAWKTLVSDKEDKRVYLIIEEINRGNCAQIFGDLFQLLDRDDNGFSDYTIEPDTDLQRYLAEEAFKECTNIPDEIRNGSLLRLPPNLFIWATMNTSDQSLFPIDSAFKRRWEWKYLPIKNDDKGHIIRVDKNRAYKWWDFVDAINKRIEKLTEQEDKQIGYWFAKPNDGLEISIDRFVSKVVFYLWNDVFKDFAKDANSPFVIKDSQNNRHELKFSMFFDDAGNAIPAAVAVFIEGLKVPRIPTPEQPQTPANDGDKTINTPDENNSVEGAELTEEEREIEEYNETFETDTTENTETIPTNDVEAELDLNADNEDGASIGKTDGDDFLKTLYKK